MSTPGSAPPAKVLLAAADPAERLRLARLLANAGLAVIEATATDEALRQVAAGRPQLVLLGELPGDPGASKIRRRLVEDPATAAIPVLLLSGDDPVCCAPLPATASPAELMDHVRCLIHLRRAEHETEIARREAEEAVRQSEARYRTLFERNPHAMFVYDTQTLVFLTVNDAAVHQYGYSRDELVRMTLLDILPPDDVSARLGALERAAPGFERRGVWRSRKKDGTLIDVEILTHTLPFGDRSACIVVAYDVTERRRLEEQFLQAQKMEAVGRLAGGVAHDFNNLLTVINGYAGMMLEDLGEGSTCAAHARAILKAGERAAALTQQLLAFGRKQIVSPRLLDVNAVVADAAALLGRVIGEDILLNLDLQSGLGRVRADPTQLEQALLNLAVNARDAMPRGGRLALTTRDTGAEIELSVADTGHGMTEAVRRHLFEPFFTTKEPGKGTGLGLAAAYGIVEQAGGRIDVETSLGAGTTFRIILPRAADPESQKPFADAAPARATVLLAEDEQGVRALARHVLEAAGYVVVEAADGTEALRLAEAARCLDLLVTDVVMPGLGGRELAERLLAHDPGLKVLYLSGHSDDEALREAVARHEIYFLAKPFTPAMLTQKVREILGARCAT
jgi:PAS domain S-box-containing protein